MQTQRPVQLVRAALATMVNALVNALVLSTFCCSAFAHPFHVSIAEAEWNQKTKMLEVALRVNPADLDRAVKPAAGSTQLVGKSDDGRRIAKYLQSVFVVRDRAGVIQKLRWVGKEVMLKEAWLYFEIELPAGLTEMTISNRLFFELEKAQTNTVNLKIGKKLKTLVFTTDRPTQPQID